MTNSKVASLTGALLAVKGGAAPNGFAPRQDAILTLQALPGFAQRLGYGAPKPRGRAAAAPAVADEGLRVTLRLDTTQHRRLRLAAAHLQETPQGLVATALDYYLTRVVPTLIRGKCLCLEAGRQPGAACAAHGTERLT